MDIKCFILIKLTYSSVQTIKQGEAAISEFSRHNSANLYIKVIIKKQTQFVVKLSNSLTVDEGICFVRMANNFNKCYLLHETTFNTYDTVITWCYIIFLQYTSISLLVRNYNAEQS